MDSNSKQLDGRVIPQEFVLSQLFQDLLHQSHCVNSMQQQQQQHHMRPLQPQQHEPQQQQEQAQGVPPAWMWSLPTGYQDCSAPEFTAMTPSAQIPMASWPQHVDAGSSCAQLHLDHQNTPVGISLAQVVEGTGLTLQLHKVQQDGVLFPSLAQLQQSSGGGTLVAPLQLMQQNSGPGTSLSLLQPEQQSNGIAICLSHMHQAQQNNGGISLAQHEQQTHGIETLSSQFRPEQQNSGVHLSQLELVTQTAGGEDLVQRQLVLQNDGARSTQQQPPLQGPHRRRRITGRERYRFLSERQKFLVFVKVLFKVLEGHSEHRTLHRAKAIVAVCTQRNRLGDQRYVPLQDAIRDRLRLVVGETYWSRVNSCCLGA